MESEKLAGCTHFENVLEGRDFSSNRKMLDALLPAPERGGE
jgi:hypothetical protein